MSNHPHSHLTLAEMAELTDRNYSAFSCAARVISNLTGESIGDLSKLEDPSEAEGMVDAISRIFQRCRRDYDASGNGAEVHSTATLPTPKESDVHVDQILEIWERHERRDESLQLVQLQLETCAVSMELVKEMAQADQLENFLIGIPPETPGTNESTGRAQQLELIVEDLSQLPLQTVLENFCAE